ncbi:MAG: GIY-YIG nuclease family protein [Ichthyobacteriaceae bacterium]|nr:GIY-YIG nuclease family protein [Ichthyobacteriaceae bacterium]
MYTILDIETTGGKFNEEGVTEIAIYKYDGHEIVDQFASLVNPEIPIQPFVVKLTGINNKMLRSAPKFYEIAKRVIEITEGTTIVAHNSSFDYRILKMEFERLGYNYERKSLCTVALSKTLIPDMPSYSLGKLCASLGIPIHDRHRATGDALATVKLFKILLNKDSGKDIITQSIVEETKNNLAPKLVSIIHNLPNTTGVYYIHNKDGEIIYIGKSKNIKKRVNQHFLNKSSRSKKMQKEIAAVTYEETGSELIALLKESKEISKNKPYFNKKYKGSSFSYGLYNYTNKQGFINLKLEKCKRNESSITAFTSLAEGRKATDDFTNQHNICIEYVSKYKATIQSTKIKIEECYNKYAEVETAEQYNLRVNSLLETLSYNNKNFVIVDKGRNETEKSAILIKDGEYKGYAFVDLEHQIHNTSILESLITKMPHSNEIKNIIQSYIRRKKVIKIIDND